MTTKQEDTLRTVEQIETEFVKIREEITSFRTRVLGEIEYLSNRVGRWGDLIYKLKGELRATGGEQIPDSTLKETKQIRPVKEPKE